MLRVPPWLRAGGWLLGRWLRAPLTAVLALALGLLWVLTRGLADIGITSGLSRPGGVFYELAFASRALAAALATWVLGRNEWIWSALSRGQRVGAEACLLLAATALSLSLAWLPALASGLPLPWVTAAASLLHVSALAQLVSRSPTSIGLRPLLLVSLVWWVPALLSGETGALASLGRFLTGPIDALTSTGIQTQTSTPVDMAPTVACALAAWLLTPDTPRS